MVCRTYSFSYKAVYKEEDFEVLCHRNNDKGRRLCRCDRESDAYLISEALRRVGNDIEQPKMEQI